MMVDEKAADLIAGNEPLPPQHAPYYRHGGDLPLYPPGDPRNDQLSWSGPARPATEKEADA
jgi:choline dehydrogenase